MPDQKQFIVTIGFRAKSGKAADLERELRNRVPIARTEAGNLDYRLYRSTTDSHLFFLFSRYTSEKSFDIHLYQPYSLSMMAEFEDLLQDPPRVETYETVLG
jgi:quinol monooxygenase YgiN